MATGLREVLAQLRHSGSGQTDGQLLGRFVATRDEGAFASLVRRHGPMVLGVCRRVLRHEQDAEDAFQATFLVLARKAASVAKRESVSCWLHGVAYHTALRAGAANVRRRATERQVRDMPHPGVMPGEVPDWRPLLDRELSLLPQKYQVAIVLCDLEGQSRREAARVLGLTEGTLSSRLARGRALLARRLVARGLALSGGGLAVTVAADAASAQVPAALVSSTSKAAALVAAGQMAGVSTPAVLLMRGVMKAMLMKKLRLAVGAVMVLVALGAVGIAYQAAGGAGAAQAAPPDKAVGELEALRRENALLKLNLEVVLEKVRAQAAELQAVRKEVAAKDQAMMGTLVVEKFFPLVGKAQLLTDGQGTPFLSTRVGQRIAASPGEHTTADPVQMMEAALKALREAKDKEGQRRATEALEKALEKLKQQGKP